MKWAALPLAGEGLFSHAAVVARASILFGFVTTLLSSPHIQILATIPNASNWIKFVEFDLPPPKIARKPSQEMDAWSRSGCWLWHKVARSLCHVTLNLALPTPMAASNITQEGCSRNCEVLIHLDSYTYCPKTVSSLTKMLHTTYDRLMFKQPLCQPKPCG